ncbi:MAG TPA: SpoIID/LytB domain-containing protein [Blastocatellia bacterium]|nr:SpoIID/LytB domain-containing protein [Blastocatellia bacterium]
MQVSEADSDASLQKAAISALGEREGTIIVMDPQSGRLRAVVNPRLAFEQTFPPGSAIKPFTALAAMRAGMMDRESLRQCSGKYARDGFEIVCSHPKSNSPFSPVQALAFSCNDYFAHLGERLSEGAFNSTLAAFGFGRRTGVNASSEAEGRLPQNEWGVRVALGESEHLLVTPIQLLVAYAALANGGHLYRPRQDKAAGFTAQEHSRISIAPAQREVLIEGMRGAVRYGTAARADLDSLPLYVFGKTGTSTSSNGFRTNGWFLGFAADQSQTRLPAPDNIHLAILVFLKRAHGAQGAEIARSVLEEYTRGEKVVASEKPLPDSRGAAPVAVKVHLVRAGVTKTVSLEDYVRGVLAAEASVEDEIEALKAQAVASRTFALRNRGRHAGDGYDFCSTTHCQRFVADEEAGRNSPQLERARRAAAETAGEVLRDERGQPIDAYFHAACGGMTANIESLWGVAAPPYLRGVRDDYCATMPHRNWVQAIPAAQLAAALRSDPQSDVGARLNEIRVMKRDASGRAEMIALEGERERVLRGWDFKLIVGRTLGWNLVKSSRFEVSRVGKDFVFRGGGFGHGLGLCQEGAHVMARRGMSRRQILSYYFPGTNLSNCAARQPHGETANARSAFFLQPASLDLSASRVTRSSEHFRAAFSGDAGEREVAETLRTLEAARADVARRLKQAALTLPDTKQTELVVYATTGDFTGATGCPPWAAAVTRGNTIHLQPLGTLRRRGVLDATLRHEYVHVVIEALGRGRAPRWLVEGLAIHVAGEGRSYANLPRNTTLSPEELEQKLARPASAQEMRELYAAAWREVSGIIRAEGEAKVWQRVAVR